LPRLFQIYIFKYIGPKIAKAFSLYIYIKKNKEKIRLRLFVFICIYMATAISFNIPPLI